MPKLGEIEKKRVFKKGQFYKRESTAVSIAGKLYEEAMEHSFRSPEGRKPEYRPSSFPLCSILTFMRLQKGASLGYFETERSASGDFFTGVGTYAHENIQFHMGFSGKVWGDWKCYDRRCKKGALGLNLYDETGTLVRKGKITRKNSTNNRCPFCDAGMEYIEKEIRLNSLCGHIDLIIKMDDGRYWIGDYKTCTKYKLESGKLPERSHLKQLPTYCYVVKKKYKLDVAGFSLIYFSRDNPFRMFEYAEKWTPEWDKKIKALIDDERNKFKSGVKSFATQDPQHAIDNKPCNSQRYYDKEINYYTPCPMQEVCFDKKKLKKTLDKHIESFPSKEQDRINLIETINIK